MTYQASKTFKNRLPFEILYISQFFSTFMLLPTNTSISCKNYCLRKRMDLLF